jgi:hypothetical protein
MVFSLGTNWEEREVKERIEIINRVINSFIDISFKIHSLKLPDFFTLINRPLPNPSPKWEGLMR